MKYSTSNQKKYLKMTKNNSRQSKRKQKKAKKKRDEAKKKILRKRESLRDEQKVEKEIERIRYLSRDRIIPYRKSRDETEHTMSD